MRLHQTPGVELLIGILREVTIKVSPRQGNILPTRRATEAKIEVVVLSRQKTHIAWIYGINLDYLLK
jgi:hypothetical protein